MKVNLKLFIFKNFTLQNFKLAAIDYNLIMRARIIKRISLNESGQSGVLHNERDKSNLKISPKLNICASLRSNAKMQ